MKHTLKNLDLIELRAAHHKLDGFQFDGKTTYDLVKNLRKLNDAFAIFEDVRSKVVQRIAPDTLQIQQNTPEWEVYMKEYQTLLHVQTEVDLVQITWADLNIDGGAKDSGLTPNKIPVTVLAVLDAYILTKKETA